jgi:membrane protein YqaA with SNARE-associated domain
MATNSTSWSASMAWVLIACIAAGLIIGSIAKWVQNREVRAIMRRRKQMRASWKQLNELRPGAFQVKSYNEWTRR